MEKTINIHISITDDQTTFSRSAPVENSTTDWEIVISSAEILAATKDTKVVPLVLIHEIGHVLGRAFLGEIKEPEDYFAQQVFGVATPRTIEEEKRAWIIGQKIFNQVRKDAMKTYTDNPAPE